MTVLIEAPTCFVCGTAAIIAVTDEEAAALASGAYMQDALPARSAAEREVLISGTHPECWDSLFPAEEE